MPFHFWTWTSGNDATPNTWWPSVSSVQSLSHVQTLRPHELQHARFPCPPTPGAYPKSCPSNWLCHPTISSSVIPFSSHHQSFPASGSFLVSESVVRIKWPKYWSFSFSISPSDEYSRLISFSVDWFDLLAVHGTLKSLLQCHRSKASILWCSAFFMVQLTSVQDYWKNHSFDYMDLFWQSDVVALLVAIRAC